MTAQTTNALPVETKVVIIGGGIIGCSTAYHLTKMGCRDVVMVERNEVTSGTTWHSAAQVRQLRSTKNMTQLVRYSQQLYSSLETEMGMPTGWHGVGSISIATNQERLTHIRRQASLARNFELETQEISRADVQAMWPLAYTDDIISAVFVPSDGRVNPSLVSKALLHAAQQNGLQLFERTAATGFTKQSGRIASVKTTRGEIKCEAVVDCAGAWGREVASKAGVSAPLYACEHLYIVSEPVAGLEKPLPTLSDHDGWLYCRDHEGGLLIGCFEPKAKPLDIRALPDDFAFGVLAWDDEHFAPVLHNAKHRFPLLQNTRIKTYLNGPESFTPDDNLLLGEAPELDGFFLGCGLNSVGMATGGGVGRALAEWVLTGETEMDLWSVDARRFGRFNNNLRALSERIPETMALHYAISYPDRDREAGRNLRWSPVHLRLAEKGAHFGARAGWERPHWFNPDWSNSTGKAINTDLTFGKPGWFEQVAHEHRTARKGVVLFDQSSFAKLMVQGRDAEAFLQRVCANNMAVEVGQIVYTGMLNQHGGYESDFTVARLAGDCFQIITGTAQATHDLTILKRQIQHDEFVTIVDVTGATAVLSVMGPKSRTLLQAVSPHDFSNKAFSFYTSQEIEIGHVLARANRLSYVGELGWELYVPAESAVPVYDALFAAGQDFGLIDAGTMALTSLRVEKGYRAWGHDISPEDTPYQAGLGFAVDLTKPSFNGRDALLRQKENGLTRRMVSMTLDTPEAEIFPLGNEPIYLNDELVGSTTSGAFGHTLGKPVMLGYLRNPDGGFRRMVKESGFEVEVACVRYPITVSLRAFYDPLSKRMKV
ncbi:MAG: FAD-dependent oxidoreductase [Chloroflexota bacterium]